jgi:sugar/nucleoside kinase (ribokinase family)
MAAPEETVGERLVRIETKLDQALTQHGEDLKDHESRIRRLERALWTVAGAGIAGGGAVGAVVSQILGAS